MKLRKKTYHQRPRPAAERGIALLLTLFAVAIAAILVMAYGGTSQTTTGIAQNAKDHQRSRQIAESAMVVSIASLQQQPNWRTTFASGVWATDVTFDSGTYTVGGEDGIDLNDDGTVDGDGDLADDANDPVTLTVMGQFNGVTHRVRAILTTGGPVQITQVAALGKVEVKGNGSVDSWNSAAGTYVATRGTDAIVSTSSAKKDSLKFKDNAIINGHAYAPPGSDPDEVIKVDGHATITGNTGVQALRQLVPSIDPPDVASPSGNSTIASGTTVVTSDMSVNGMEIKNSATLQIEGDVIIYVADQLKIKDDAQVIVTEGSKVSFYVAGEIKMEGDARINTLSQQPSRVVFYSLGKKKVEVKDDVQVYAAIIAPGAEVKIKDDAELFGAVIGRKLKIEHDAAIHHDLNPITVPAGTTLFDNGGAAYGLAADEEIELKDNARVSGYNGSIARVSINNNASNKFKIGSHVQINGNVYVGPTGDPDTVIDCSGNLADIVTGNVGVSDLSVAMTADDAPFTGSASDQEYSSGSHTISADRHFKKLAIKNTAIITISGDVTIQCDDDFKLENTAQLRIAANSKLTLVLLKKCEIKDEARFNVSSGDPAAAEVHLIGSDKCEIQNDCVVYATMLVPDDELKVKDEAVFYGTARAKKIKIEGNGHLHIATEEGDGPPDLGSGKFIARWIE